MPVNSLTRVTVWRSVERLIGSIRRECLEHVPILSDCGLRRILRLYFDYYERSRTHLSLGKDAPVPRPIQAPSLGRLKWNCLTLADLTIVTNEGLLKETTVPESNKSCRGTRSPTPPGI